jgi:TIR domain
MSAYNNYQYDVALSFAEEDRDIALSLSLALNQLSITVYYYPDEIEKTWGADIERKLKEIYKEKARYAIVILSEKYFKKKYAAIEFASIQQRIVMEKGTVYMLPVLHGGLSLLETHKLSNLAFIKWQYNAVEIAQKLKMLLGVTIAEISADDKYRNYQEVVNSNRYIVREMQRRIIPAKLTVINIAITLLVLAGVVVLLVHQGVIPASKARSGSIEPDIIPPAVDTCISCRTEKYDLSISKDTSTAIHIHKGDSIIIRAGGMMRVGAFIGSCGPEGVPNNKGVFGVSIAEYNYFKEWNHAALFYRFAKTSDWQFYEKTNARYLAAEEGILDIGINDKKQTDNKGHYDVVVLIKKNDNQ